MDGRFGDTPFFRLTESKIAQLIHAKVLVWNAVYIQPEA
jgi:hypothetical protein